MNAQSALHTNTPAHKTARKPRRTPSVSAHCAALGMPVLTLGRAVIAAPTPASLAAVHATHYARAVSRVDSLALAWGAHVRHVSFCTIAN